MKIVNTKAFRARLAEFAARAEAETIYISRPGGRLLKLTSVPEGDIKQILEALPESENSLTDSQEVDG